MENQKDLYFFKQKKLIDDLINKNHQLKKKYYSDILRQILVSLLLGFCGGVGFGISILFMLLVLV